MTLMQRYGVTGMPAAGRPFLIVLVLGLGLILGGCERGEPRIDASTEESTEQSVDRLAGMMSAEDEALFRQAIEVLHMHETTAVREDEQEAELPPAEREALVEQRVRERLHNRTANEVVEQVLEIAEDRLGPESVPESLRE